MKSEVLKKAESRVEQSPSYQSYGDDRVGALNFKYGFVTGALEMEILMLEQKVESLQNELNEKENEEN